MALLHITDCGLYCAAGDFYIDPWRAVDHAVITHAHSDHAHAGSRYYLTAEPGRGILEERLGTGSRIETLPYGQSTTRQGVTISLHPAGHILGSAQVRVEHQGEVWVASGDYKAEAEPTCQPFEPVRCHTFITESTFGLPIYRWPPQETVFHDINRWWQLNQAAGRTSVLYAYSLGKAQRLMAGVNAAQGPIFVHNTVAQLLPFYEAAGVKLPQARRSDLESAQSAQGRGLVIAPSSVDGTSWLHRFGEVSTAFASGWMLLRGTRRRRALDRGFVISDHADWPGLISSIQATGAERILVMHGYTEPLVRWLRENGWNAESLESRPKIVRAEAAEEESLPGP